MLCNHWKHRASELEETLNIIVYLSHLHVTQREEVISTESYRYYVAVLRLPPRRPEAHFFQDQGIHSLSCCVGCR